MGRRLTPSIFEVKLFTPIISAIVGNMSIVAAILEETLFASIRLGHLIIQGTLAPPSHMVPFPSRKGPAEPPHSPKFNQGPLSLANMTKVLSSILFAFSDASISPTDQSISIITSP